MNGIDISHWNGDIDFSKVVTDALQIKFVIIKSSQGVSSVDSKVHIYAAAAKQNNLYVSYYHYADTSLDPIQQANFFLQTLKGLPANDFPLVIDIEENKGGLSKDQMKYFISSFCSTVSSAGREIGIYTYADFLNENLPVNHGLGNIPLFLSAYTSKAILPHGWTSYYLWQFSNKGNVAGMSGDVDLDNIPNFKPPVSKKKIIGFVSLAVVLIFLLFFCFKSLGTGIKIMFSFFIAGILFLVYKSTTK